MKEQDMNDFYNSSNLPINGNAPKETDKIYYDFGKYIPLDGLNPEDIVKMMENNEEIEDKENKITISGSVVQNEANQLYYILLKASEILKEDVNIHMTVDENEEEIIMKENTQEATSTEPVNKYCKITNVRISTSSENDNTIYIDNIYNQNGSGNFNITLFDVIENEENKISETEHEYGTNIQLTVNDIEGYEFTKWEVISDSNTITGNTNTIEFIMPEENVVIKCYYTLRQYTIKFMNGDETLQETTVNFGEMPTYNGETPTKESDEQYTYTFNGWEPEISEVTGEATYTATFVSTLRQYTITWKNEDGTTLQETSVNYGETPVYYGETPTKEEDEQYTYTFSSWDPEITTVIGEATYTAQFEATVRQYTIKFVNGDTTLQETIVNYGEIPAYTGETPTKEGNEQYTYAFKGWDPEISAVTGETTYTATFEETVRQYTIKFTNGDETLQETTVNYGDTPVYTGETPTKAEDEQYTYTFKGWDPTIESVTSDATYTAKFEATVRQYTIKFVNGDTTLQETSVNYGEIPTYNGETPTKAEDEQYTYTFKGWDPEISAVTGETTYTATFEETVRQYTIKFMNGDETLQETIVNYGEIPAYTGETPTKEGNEQYTYTFNAWSPAIESVKGNATYSATFEETVRHYTITWENEDGTVLSTSTVNYGETPVYNGETPTKADDEQYTYTFSSWTPAIESVTGEVTYTAQFEATLRQYTIKFMNGDETLQETSVNYGQIPVYTGETPTKESNEQYTYTFSSWSPEITAVTGETTYTATFESKVREYTITWENEDGTVLSTSIVEYGQIPEYTGETPTKASDGQYTYTFKGWDPEISAVTGNQTYTAQFEMHEYENEYEYIYITDCSETPTSGATAETSGSIGTADTSGFEFIDGIDENTPNTQLNSTSSKYILTFDPNLDLSNYDNVKLEVWWAASPSNNSEIKLFINNSEVGSDEVDSKNDREKLRLITTDIDNNSIETLTIQGNKSSGAILFRVGIKGTPKEYLLTVNENEIGNIKVGEDISQYLTYEEKEGMIHKWMEGETEFIGSIMPNRDLILTSVYTEVSTNSKTIYYGAVNTNEINTLTSNDIQELEHYDYVDGEEKAVIFMLPIRPDLWEEYYTYEDDGNTQEMQEWEQRNNYDYFIAAPSNIVSLVLKNGIGAEHDIAAHETININGIEYIKYYTNLGWVAEEEQSATIPMNITIN